MSLKILQMLNSVLIVEDELELSGILSKYLNRRHFQVDCVETLKDSLNLLLHKPFSFLILDNNLPDGKGLEYIEQFKTMQPDLKIIAMSALQIHDAALKAGANYFIEKPISLKAIEKILTAA